MKFIKPDNKKFETKNFGQVVYVTLVTAFTEMDLILLFYEQSYFTVQWL